MYYRLACIPTGSYSVVNDHATVFNKLLCSNLHCFRFEMKVELNGAKPKEQKCPSSTKRQQSTLSRVDVTVVWWYCYLLKKRILNVPH